MRESTKYPKEALALAVSSSFSLAEVMKKLGKKWSGGQQQNLKRWISTYGIDTSHFLGQSRGRNQVAKNRKLPEEVLVLDDNLNWRFSSARLRRALQELGVPYECAECQQGPAWRGKKLTLQVNHKNGDWKDNRKENLEFLCPNCHAITDNWSRS